MENKYRVDVICNWFGAPIEKVIIRDTCYSSLYLQHVHAHASMRTRTHAHIYGYIHEEEKTISRFYIKLQKAVSKAGLLLKTDVNLHALYYIKMEN